MNNNGSVGTPIVCPLVRLDSVAKASAIAEAFSESSPLLLKQPWRSAPEERFRPCRVRLGWRKGELLVWAELEDDDIHNAAVKLNQPTWELGDVFEVFLRNPEHEENLEFHITPENKKLQLRTPSIELLRCRGWRSFLIEQEIFTSETFVYHERSLWCVFAAIPFRELLLPDEPIKRQIQFSFCRYDYSRSSRTPILSTTSHSSEIDFNLRSGWGYLTINGWPRCLNRVRDA